MPTTVRDRLVDAAFELFEQQGYDATTIDDIAARADTSRSTFFRHFRGKDDVVLPDHDALLARVGERLSMSAPGSRAIALREGARVPLDHYLAEGPTAMARYRLASTIPSIRDREIASVQRYVRLFAQHVHGWLEDDTDGPLRAELVASSIVIAHNHVLRRWLRGEQDEPTTRAGLDRALDRALLALRADPSAGGATIVISGPDPDVEQVLEQVRAALNAPR
ncbi:TetR/AcrR family transcriptional regulator [Nocardioides caeni]|uniref:TetR family transcriptional regulator n=1 Tax=Nocardioides caeni TaxID=574700 RepID=A0A4V4HLD6_9ACTN|nr:TetR/AcrR family transcriptional regulator [Nocardioides caeni]THV17886.1 TetR family transcriptional regulator [Nocardioides caeni]